MENTKSPFARGFGFQIRVKDSVYLLMVVAKYVDQNLVQVIK